MNRIPDYRLSLMEDLRRQRRQMAETSPAAFARVYLGHHFKLPPSRMHTEMFTMLADASANRPRRLAIAAPRGHAKTTVVSLAYVLWSILYKKEAFVLLVSATQEQAIQLLKTIRTELQGNGYLLEDFPEACVPADGGPLVRPWKDAHIVLPNGVAVRAIGSEQRMRGIKHNQHRPSLIVVDDLEDQVQTASAEQRQKLRTWFEGTLLKMSEPRTNVVVVGTVLHYDSLLANLIGAQAASSQTRISGWESRKYQAVEAHSERPELWAIWDSIFCGDAQHEGATGPEAARMYYDANRAALLQGTRVLWEELDSYQQLMITRVREGRLSFQAEKQNEPLDPDECLFRDEKLRYWDGDHADAAALITSLGSSARVYGACDPSMGRKGGRGDFSAIVTLVEDRKTKTFYVVVADIALRSPAQTIERIVEYARMYKYREFAIEANGFQEILSSQLKEAVRAAGLSLPIKEIKHSSDKKGRIESLEPLITQGVLKLSRRHGVLLEQLRQFPLGAHDDGPDALEMAVQTARRRRNHTVVCCAITGRVIHDSDWEIGRTAP